MTDSDKREAVQAEIAALKSDLESIKRRLHTLETKHESLSSESSAAVKQIEKRLDKLEET